MNAQQQLNILDPITQRAWDRWAEAKINTEINSMIDITSKIIDERIHDAVTALRTELMAEIRKR